MGLISVSMVTSSGLVKDFAFLGCCWVVEMGGVEGGWCYIFCCCRFCYFIIIFSSFFYYHFQHTKEAASQPNAMLAAYPQQCCSLGGAPGQLSSPKCL